MYSARYPQGIQFLSDLVAGKPVDFEDYFREMNAIVDCIYAFDELFTRYPDAKVILTLRDMDR